MTDLERALGQFVLYRFLLSSVEPDRSLYLATACDVYAELFDIAHGRDLAAAQSLKFLVFDPDQEVIVRWIE